MPDAITVHTGGCHCGRLEVRFETGLRSGDMPVRACQCSFCRRHGTRCVADPDGRAWITVRDEKSLVRYRFGLNTADFLVCGRCGVYVGARLAADGGGFATLNINAFETRDAFTQTATLVSYAAETEAERRARRRRRWTPTRLEITGSR